MRRLALAASGLVMGAAAAAAQGWDGPYGGIQLGFMDAETSGATAIEGDGAIGGVHIGYDVDLGAYVVGGELDYDAADVDLGSGTAAIDNVTRLKIRAGSGSGSTLVYGTAGLALVDTTLGDDEGYFVGAGVGQQMGGWVLGGEVLFHQFDDIDGSGVDADATTFSLRATFQF